MEIYEMVRVNCYYSTPYGYVILQNPALNVSAIPVLLPKGCQHFLGTYIYV